MTPQEHSELHARKWGGTPEDYIEIDEFLDSTKYHFTDHRHRAILHNGFGMQLCVRLFGQKIYPEGVSEGVPVRDIAMEHIRQDLGHVPTLADWLRHMKSESWMRRPPAAKQSTGVLDREFFEGLNPNA